MWRVARVLRQSAPDPPQQLSSIVGAVAALDLEITQRYPVDLNRRQVSDQWRDAAAILTRVRALRRDALDPKDVAPVVVNTLTRLVLPNSAWPIAIALWSTATPDATAMGPEVTRRIIRHLFSCHEWKLMLRLYQQSVAAHDARREQAAMRNSIGSKQLELGLWDHALNLVRHGFLHGDAGRPPLLTSVFTALNTYGRWRESVHLFDILARALIHDAAKPSPDISLEKQWNIPLSIAAEGVAKFAPVVAKRMLLQMATTIPGYVVDGHAIAAIDTLPVKRDRDEVLDALESNNRFNFASAIAQASSVNAWNRSLAIFRRRWGDGMNIPADQQKEMRQHRKSVLSAAPDAQSMLALLDVLPGARKPGLCQSQPELKSLMVKLSRAHDMWMEALRQIEKNGGMDRATPLVLFHALRCHLPWEKGMHFLESAISRIPATFVFEGHVESLPIQMMGMQAAECLRQGATEVGEHLLDIVVNQNGRPPPPEAFSCVEPWRLALLYLANAYDANAIVDAVKSHTGFTWSGAMRLVSEIVQQGRRAAIGFPVPISVIRVILSSIRLRVELPSQWRAASEVIAGLLRYNPNLPAHEEWANVCAFASRVCFRSFAGPLASHPALKCLALAEKSRVSELAVHELTRNASADEVPATTESPLQLTRAILQFVVEHACKPGSGYPPWAFSVAVGACREYSFLVDYKTRAAPFWNEAMQIFTAQVVQHGPQTIHRQTVSNIIGMLESPQQWELAVRVFQQMMIHTDPTFLHIRQFFNRFGAYHWKQGIELFGRKHAATVVGELSRILPGSDISELIENIGGG